MEAIVKLYYNYLNKKLLFINIWIKLDPNVKRPIYCLNEQVLVLENVMKKIPEEEPPAESHSPNHTIISIKYHKSIIDLF